VPLDARRLPAQRDGVVLGVRPESFEDAAFAAPGLPSIEVRVDVVEDVGADAYVHFGVDSQRITAESLEAGTDDATLLAESSTLFTARIDPRTKATPGSSFTLAIDPARFHFFDGGTGASLVDAEELPAVELGLDHSPAMQAAPR
jgi:multiple sugar transport system ATP-binding protein